MFKEQSQRLTACWVIFSFIVWAYVFWGYLSSKFLLVNDALSYHDHTKFFIDNISHGVYPLWDPFWYYGSPNDFFLRRIGALNPFYFLIVILKAVGIPYILSYLWFLALYYWGGMIAFYLLIMRIYENRLMAYLGYLLLLFSSLGTRLFDSYMMLITVPVIWFFYFLVAFSQRPNKHFFLGMLLSLMILVGTYIPLYFFVILGFFLLIYSILYMDQLRLLWGRYIDFFKKNSLFMLLSIFLLLVSFIPIAQFYHETALGQVVMPIRHGAQDLGHSLTVPRQTLDWGAVEDFMYSAYFSDLRLLKFAVVYIPFISIIILSLGLLGRITRRAIFIFLLGFILLCCIVPHGLPFYNFLYNHIFIFKYFRNLHFFIWFFLIPLFVLLVVEHLNIFLKMVSDHSIRKKWLLFYVFVCHFMLLIFVLWRNDAIASTYGMIFFSLILFSLFVTKGLKPNGWFYALLTVAVLIQPIEAYHYFSLKALKFNDSYSYDFPWNEFTNKSLGAFTSDNPATAKPPLYFASGRYNYIYQNISNHALSHYLSHKIILVDHVGVFEGDSMLPLLEDNLSSDANMALVRLNKGEDVRSEGNSPYPAARSEPIDENPKEFKVLEFNANHARFLVNVPYDKFLIYNDSYDPYWKVRLNNKPVKLYEANGAFKGIWISAGKNVIDYNYASWWQYAMNAGLSMLAVLVLLMFIWHVFVFYRKSEH